MPTPAEKAESKRCTRHFERYSSETRANLAASHRTRHRQRQAVGEYFWTHPDIPDRCFETRIGAARAALRRKAEWELTMDAIEH